MSQLTPRTWRRAAFMGPLALVVALGYLAAGAWTLQAERGWSTVVYLLGGVVFGLMAAMSFRRRTVADPTGIRAYDSGWVRPEVDLQWRDVVAIRPSTASSWADHVVVESTDGTEHRLLMVPPTDLPVLEVFWGERTEPPDG